METRLQEIAAQLIHRPLFYYPNTLYLNLYQNHFSYVKDMKKYAKWYCCSRCGTYWKHAGMLNRHERTCEVKMHCQFPGGTYKTSPLFTPSPFVLVTLNSSPLSGTYLIFTIRCHQLLVTGMQTHLSQGSAGVKRTSTFSSTSDAPSTTLQLSKLSLSPKERKFSGLNFLTAFDIAFPYSC